jgi:streptogramin lyase
MAVAIDGSGSAWVTNNGNSSITKLTNTGVAASGSSGYTGGVMSAAPQGGLAIDGSGNVWVTLGQEANGSQYPFVSNVTEFIGAATPVVTPIVANLIAPYSAPASKP